MNSKENIDLIKNAAQFCFDNNLSVCIKTYHEEVFKPAKIINFDTELQSFEILCSLETFTLSLFDVKSISWTGKGA